MMSVIRAPRSAVQRSTGEGDEGLAEHLAHRRVGLDEVGDLVHRRLPVDGQVAAAELLGHPWAHHVHAEHASGLAVGALLGDHLHETLGLVDDHRTGVVRVLGLVGHDVVAGVLGRLLRQPGEGDLGRAVDAPRHPVVGDGHRVLTEHVLDGDDRLGEADVGEGGRGDEVTDRPRPFDRGAAQLVDLHEATVVDLDTRPLEAEGLRERPAADGDDDEIGLDRLAAVDLDDCSAALLRRVPGHGDTGADVDALAPERLHDHVGDVLVAARQDLRQPLEDRHLRAEVGEHRRELAPDGTATDHDRRGRQRREVEELVGGDDEGALDIEAGDRPRHRSGGEDHRVGGELGLRAVVGGDGDGAVGVERSGPDEGLRAAPLERRLKALPVAFDDRALAGEGDVPVEAGDVGEDAVLLGVLHVSVRRRRLEQLLGRDATPVQARAPDLVLLDEGDLETGRSAVQGGGVPARTTTDDDDVELLSHVGRAYPGTGRSFRAPHPSNGGSNGGVHDHCCPRLRWPLLLLRPDRDAMFTGTCRAATVAAMSTRGLIVAALLCGLAILVAFAVQVAQLD